MSEKICPYLEEAGIAEECDFEDMFKRPPSDEDCRYCLAGLVEGSREDAKYWEERYGALMEALRTEGSLLLQMIAALKSHEHITTTELRLRISPHPKPRRLRKLLRLLPVEAVRVRGGYRWRLKK